MGTKFAMRAYAIAIFLEEIDNINFRTQVLNMFIDFYTEFVSSSIFFKVCL